jgi:PAS domain S-box-containing protein
MKNAEFQLQGVGDPRLAVHATSSLPAWLWSTDGTRVLWANPVGAGLFDARNGAVLAAKSFGPANPHRRQVAQLAGRLPSTGAMRLERLRGFGASLGGLMTCACAQLNFPNGGAGILIVATEPSGRVMPLVERLQRLVEGIDTPIAAFARDGMFVGGSDAARSLLGFRNLSEAGLDTARSDALKQGRAETPIGIGHMVLQRVGSGADVGLVALIEPKQPVAEPEAVAPETPEPIAAVPTPDYEAPPIFDDAPFKFALVDEFAEPSASPTVEEIVAVETPQPADTPASELEMALPVEAPHAEAPPNESPLNESIETPTAMAVREDEPSPFVEAVADEPSAPVEAIADEPSRRIETAADETPLSSEAIADQPSPPIEAVAEELSSPLPVDAPATAEQPVTSATLTSGGALPSWIDEPLQPRRHPLRFMWQMDAEGRFSLGSDEFTRLIGVRTAAAFGRLWSEIAEAFALDPEGRVMKAVSTRDTWSGVTLNWPVDGGARLPVELSGLPIYDRAHHFAGYRGFGVCRDLEGLARLASLRRHEFFSDPPAQAPLLRSQAKLPQPLSVDIADAVIADNAGSAAEPGAAPAPTSEPIVQETSNSSQPEASVETPKNVLPFRPVNEVKSPSLTPVENNAFNELARQLAARLEAEKGTLTREPDPLPVAEAPDPETSHTETPDHGGEQAFAPEQHAQDSEQPAQPEWLIAPEPPARGATLRDKALLDLLPVGVLIYRLDRLLYANRAFLDRIGYESLAALEAADGLDALFVEPVGQGSSTSDAGTAVTIAATPASANHAPLPPTEARLFTISWDDESALALICSNAPAEPAPVPVAVAEVAAPVVAAVEPSPVGHADAEELGAILDTMAEGVVMFDAQGNLNSCNRSAEALFGYDGADLTQRNLADLFAPESQRVIQDYLESIAGAGVASLLDHGRDVLGRVRGGGLVPLSMTMGRTRPDGANFFAVFRDLSQARKNETELSQARRQAERSANAKADVLARISHEVRTPLNAIIGFSEVMIDERFGALGNERYVEYMKDIRASGERVIAIINDLLDLSRIETGKIDLAFANQNLNELVESCVAVMQPQANRERIIIRTSLAHMLPAVVADARALRQIALNLIGNSIHLANAGGQVIVSTALSDFGEVVLRVRDTGHGLNDNEVAAAMEPFRTQGPTDQTADSSGVSLSLTKALVEANRAQFQIKTAPHSGTLIEVVFSHAAARA